MHVHWYVHVCLSVLWLCICVHKHMNTVLCPDKRPTALLPTYSFNSIIKAVTSRNSLHAWMLPHLYIPITQQKHSVCQAARCMLQGDSE